MKLIFCLGEYALVNRGTSIEPWVAAFSPVIKDNQIIEWGNGNYFEKIEDAILYILKKEKPEAVTACAEEIQTEDTEVLKNVSPCDIPDQDGVYHCPFSDDPTGDACRNFCGVGVDE